MNCVRTEFSPRRRGPGLAQRLKRPSRSGSCRATRARRRWSPRTDEVQGRGRRWRAGDLGGAEPVGTSDAQSVRLASRGGGEAHRAAWRWWGDDTATRRRSVAIGGALVDEEQRALPP
jgi:hypothetical protein